MESSIGRASLPLNKILKQKKYLLRSRNPRKKNQIMMKMTTKMRTSVLKIRKRVKKIRFQ